MSEKKNFFKVRRTRVWFITTASIAALAITVNVLATSNLLSGVLNAVFGGPRAILADTSSVLYEKKTTSKADAKANSESVTKELTSEGIVLLKNSNNALPLKAGAKVSVFGKNSVSMIYGSSGSGGGDSTEAVTLYQSLTDAGFSYNAKLKSFYDDSNASGSGRTPNPSIENSGNVVLETGETPIASYTNDVQSSYGEYSDAAIVVFTRIAGEGFDLPMTMGYNKDRHYLQLDDNETALLKHVCEQSFSHVIVLINSNNPMELGFLDDSTNYAFQEKIDAALWCGGFGNVGITSFGKVLSGAINPSGHLPDTYVRDFKQDPVWQNFGNNRIFGGKTTGDQYNEDGDPINYYFVDYEEGIYVGYRYWETRGKSEGEDWYKSHVVYPFGYGLSYSSFTWEVENKEELQSKQITKDGTIEVKVKVTNDSEVAGKDVVEIYAGLPYTAGGIEKPYEALAGFAKTSLLKPHASESVTVEIDPYYLASFDENDANRNDFKGYELEAGDYQLFVNSDAHTVKDTITLPKLETGIEWANDPVTGTAVTPQFTDSALHLQSTLSRNDWNGTFPASPTDDDRNVFTLLDNKNIDIEKLLADTTTANPISVTEMPKQETTTHTIETTDADGKKTERAMILRDMIGKDYDDPLWDDLLNQMSIGEMTNIYNKAAFNTASASSISKPKTTEADGPSGFTLFMGDPTVYGTCKFCNETVVAATWNVDLAKKMGEAVGEEGLWGNARGDGMPYSGWYAPGMNIHRGQFGGRQAEYYSEDPLLTGKFAASVVSGAKEKGVYCMMKHFALNEQETHRAVGGSNSWCNEQAIREIYLRPFEIAVKEGKATGVMSSFNRIGTKWTGGDYRLLTTVLRNEWGFHGSVICDFNTNPSYMISKEMAYAGGNLNLATQPKDWVDSTNATDVTVLRSCTKDTLYTVVNSCVYNADVKGYRNPIWVNVMILVDCLLAAGFAGWGFWAIFSTYHTKKAVPQDGETKTESK